MARAADSTGSPAGESRPAGVAVRVVACWDDELSEAVEVREVERQRTHPHRQLQVSLVVENRSVTGLRFGVQVQFLDADHAPYGDRSTRRVVCLEPGRARRVVATSDREKATDFVVRLTRW